MNKILTTLLSIFVLTNCNAQNLTSHKEQIEKAKQELQTSISLFSTSIVDKDLDSSINALIVNADNNFKKYIVGGLLFEIDKGKSFQLHKEAYQSNEKDENFVLEYAIELHRNGNFKEAAELYEKYAKQKTDDYRVYVWLADCYINLDQTQKSIDNWNKANHPKNHTGIDFAIHTIYGNTNQVRQRNDFRKQILNGDLSKFYDLIFLDQNWEMDWWNKKAQVNFLNEDLKLAKQKLTEISQDFKLLKAYTDIKKIENDATKITEIKSILITNQIILNNKTLPQVGQIASDLLRICFINQFLNETEYYKQNGDNLLQISNKTNDKDLLNIYAYLQATVDGQVKPEIDKRGWTQFKDERFAISYFLGKADKNRFDDPELKQALIDFPNSSKLYWVKLNCAKIEKKKLKPIIAEVIKREFKTLGSEEGKYSYYLKNYFVYLQTEE